MSEPWLNILGIGEDGLAGLSVESRDALDQSTMIFGAARHLELANVQGRGRCWPVPFSIAPVLQHRGSKVAVLASGDPFCSGVGPLLTRQLARNEWCSHPVPSSYSLAASQLGWTLEDTVCMALHAAPFERMNSSLAAGSKILCLVKDGSAVGQLASWLVKGGFGLSELTVMEALGGPRQRVRCTRADGFALSDVGALVLVAIRVAGASGLPCASGLADSLFVHDGQITRRAIRALTLSALAPRNGQRLWDIGAGSGSVSVEWCLAAPATRSIAIESRSDRLLNMHTNVQRFGLQHRIRAVQGWAPSVLQEQPLPDAVFIGGGASENVLQSLWSILPEGSRLVVNAVTLETESLLCLWQARTGGELMRIELAEAGTLGRRRGWQPARPVVQWSVQR